MRAFYRLEESRAFFQPAMLMLLIVMAALGLAACASAPSASQISDATPAVSLQQQYLPALSLGDLELPTGCVDLDPHPIGQSIAEKYEIPYEQVIGLFCAGYSFENILVALETSQSTQIDPYQLLTMLETSTWDEIWVEIGLLPSQ